MKRLLFAAAALTLMASVSMAGLTFTLNPDALELLWHTDSKPTGTISRLDNLYPSTSGGGNDPIVDGVTYVGILKDDGGANSPFVQIQIGANFMGTSPSTGNSGATTAAAIAAATGVAETGNIEVDNSLVGYDAFALTFRNADDDIWWVNTSINTGYTTGGYSETDNYYESGWTELASGSSATLTVDLTSAVNLNHVTNIGFNVGGNMIGGTVPYNPGNPDWFHISVTPIPEPVTFAILGLGSIGLLRLRKKS